MKAPVSRRGSTSSDRMTYLFSLHVAWELMITKKQFQEAQRRAANQLLEAGIVLTKNEKESIEVADFGLGDLEHFGLEIVVYVNTDRCCAKELVLFPFQTCPEHLHPDIGDNLGKEETFRCRRGRLHLYVPGPKTEQPHAKIPASKLKYFTVWNEIVLDPGEQFTLPPKTLHWFQAGNKGAIVSEFSSKSVDEKDQFTDPEIERTTIVS